MRHLLDTKTLRREDALRILDIAEDMADTQSREVKKLPTLRGKTVVNLFFEDSTRTRISFEAAAKRLSADVINFAAKGSSVSKGESLQDTAQTLQAMGADAVVIRHGASGAPRTLASSGWITAGVVNAGDGTHEHPTQALLDAFTMRRRRHGAASRGHDLEGLRVTIVGDILHSRVARSNVWLLHALGAEVTLVAPPTLVPQDVSAWPVRVLYDLDEAIATGPDAIMMLRIQLERMNAAYFPSEREYARRWGLDAGRLAALPADTMVMHPGPMNRGLEISSDAADSPRSTVLEQVANGVSVRMAVLYLLADPPRQDGRQPVLRGLHPHPHLVRGRREAPQRRRHQLRREGFERVQGREPAGHGADTPGDGCGCGRHPARRIRRAAHARLQRLDHRRRRERRRRDARAPHAGAAGCLHDAQAPPRRREPRQGPRGPPCHDRRRHPALPRRTLERLAPRGRSARTSPWSHPRRWCRRTSPRGRCACCTTSTRRSRPSPTP